MYEIFEELCLARGVTPYKVSQATKVRTSTLSQWKLGRYQPKQDKLQKIADYFGVSLDYLMYGYEKEKNDKFSKENAKLVTLIRNDTELAKALNKYCDFSIKKKKHVIELINLLSE